MGTKEKFRGWLLDKKGMTYTKYTSLAIDVKRAIYEEYHKK
jgi:hypothetical protein